MNLSLFIARRYLISKKSHNAINIISAVSIGGICIGTMALIIVLSGFNGLSDLVKSLYNSFNADIRITHKQGKMFQLNDLDIRRLKKMKGVRFYTEVLEENALLKYNDQQCLASIRGVSDDYQEMSRFDTLVKEGNFILKSGPQNMAVIGKGISYLLNVGPGELLTPVSVYAPIRGISTSLNPEDGFNKQHIYVSGVFSINDDFDYKYVLVPIDFARRVFDYTNEVSAVELGLSSGVNAELIKQQISDMLGKKFVVKNKYEQNELLFKTLKSEKLWTFIILVFIMVVATFNVIGSLTMLIIEKKKDIGILWNMGADLGLIQKIFLIEGTLITLIGIFSGLLLGTLICLGQQQFSWVTFNESFVVSAYPVKMLAIDYIVVFAVVLFIGLLAAWYPVKLFTRRYFAVFQTA
ncbi:MAG: ABC transporter permease [Bacteroidetes bacterium]|nr:ABC transporter permease [Bacteroidota bacterium]